MWFAWILVGVVLILVGMAIGMYIEKRRDKNFRVLAHSLTFCTLFAGVMLKHKAVGPGTEALIFSVALLIFVGFVFHTSCKATSPQVADAEEQSASLESAEAEHSDSELETPSASLPSY